MTAVKNQINGYDIRKAKTRAFWHGIAEGFGGPVLMGCDLNIPSPSCLDTNTVSIADGWQSQEISRALNRAAKQIMLKRGLASFVVKEKRLDGSGKMRDFEVLIVQPRQSVHGKPQK